MNLSTARTRARVEAPAYASREDTRQPATAMAAMRHRRRDLRDAARRGQSPSPPLMYNYERIGASGGSRGRPVTVHDIPADRAVASHERASRLPPTRKYRKRKPTPRVLRADRPGQPKRAAGVRTHFTTSARRGTDPSFCLTLRTLTSIAMEAMVETEAMVEMEAAGSRSPTFGRLPRNT